MVAAADGYPNAYQSGLDVGVRCPRPEIRAVKCSTPPPLEPAVWCKPGGGRCFTATGVGSDLEAARANACALLQQVRFPGAWWRTDIGAHLLNRPPAA